MKEIENADVADDAENNLNRDVQLDPSSISLFSSAALVEAPVFSNGEILNNVYNGVGPLASKTPAPPTLVPIVVTKPAESIIVEKKKATSYSSYVAGKATEVAKRRNLNERIDRLRSGHGIIFNVPQCQEITLNQLAIFLRRFRKSSDARQVMSLELMLKIFHEDKPEDIKSAVENTAGGVLEKPLKHSTINGQRDLLQNVKTEQPKQNANYPAVISVNDLFGDSDERSSSVASTSFKDEDEELTELSTDEEASDLDEQNESADDVLSPSTSNYHHTATDQNAFTEERFKFYKRRTEILSADIRALTFYRRLVETQAKVRSIFSNLSLEIEFSALPHTGNEEEDSQTCARCRPMLHRPTRSLMYSNFSERRDRSPRRITPNLYCGTLEYSAVDDSIHPCLSLPSAIPMERKVQKYLQVSGTLPREVERRRQKTADLAFKKTGKLNKNLFHFAEELIFPEEDEPTPSTIISLSFKKKQLGRREDDNESVVSTISRGASSANGSRHLNHRIDYDDEYQETTDSDDNDFSPRVRKRHNTSYHTNHNGHFNHLARKATTSHFNENEQVVQKEKKVTLNQKKQEKEEENYRVQRQQRDRIGVRRSDGRRSSLHSAYGREEFGSSIFDFDPSFTSIGITAVQNVENKQIAIPLFRQKDVLDYSVKKPCDCCEALDKDPFSKIRQLHDVLEAQEKQRFKVCKGPRTRP